MGRRDRDKGRLIAKQLWPELVLTEEGSLDDRNGIDAYFSEQKVQIKYNSRIIFSNNLYHENYEKTANRPDQPWRKSLANAEVYIFITEDKYAYTAYLVTVDELANREVGKTLRAIYPNMGEKTSIGFLLKLNNVNKVTRTIKKPQLF